MTGYSLARRLMPLKLKRKLAGMLSNKVTGYLLGVVYRNQIPFHGVTVNTEREDLIRRKTVSDLIFKIYERAEIDQVRAHLCGDYDVVELGGSIGVNTMQIRRKMRADRRLIVVEAAPHLAEILNKNLIQNKLDHNVLILNRAIDYSGADSVSFSVAESNLSGKVQASSSGGNKNVVVKTTRLDKILQENGIHDFVLVSDIEGMEIPIFVEDSDSLKRCRQIFIEIDGVQYQGKRYSVEDIIDRIKEIGFSVIERYHNCVAFERN